MYQLILQYIIYILIHEILAYDTSSCHFKKKLFMCQLTRPFIILG